MKIDLTRLPFSDHDPFVNGDANETTITDDNVLKTFERQPEGFDQRWRQGNEIREARIDFEIQCLSLAVHVGNV
jgi:hypothetical protein